MKLVGVYGASGLGREVMPLIREGVASSGDRELVFIDDRLSGGYVNGCHVLSYEDFLAAAAERKEISFAIADSKVRERLALRAEEDGILIGEAIASNAVVLDDVEIGAGSIIFPFVTLTSNIRIGRQFHANIYSYVAHDCVIGDYVTFAPGVKCNGNVVVEDHAYIGAGAIIKQGRPGEPLVIGRGAVVGMGAVVTKSIAPGMTVVGNPAHLFER
ncbi:acetyltransferase [Cupriavidus sp. USMAHM13]|uniref:acetyltransferase n=1 Tax=Cupriavidus sp. USMAHM13 TaxID=1389192 RepID=UPI0008A6BC34|nr:acetyltransferase [Cupriavidus sp. USMAHM13]AOY98923.1 acetyltransferase [Cupriavidus sp. USMAHM13]